MTILRTLRDAARRGVVRGLVCPRCLGPVELRGEQYWCVLNGSAYRTLAELIPAVRP